MISTPPEGTTGKSVTFSGDVMMDYGSNPAANTVKYIVDQNTDLHRDIERVKTENVRLKRALKDAEYNETSSEKSRLCIRCVAHNEIEKSKILRGLVSKYEQSRKSTVNCVVACSICMASILLMCATRVFENRRSPYPMHGDDVYIHDGAWVALMACCFTAAIACMFPVPKGSLETELRRVDQGTAHIHELVDEL